MMRPVFLFTFVLLFLASCATPPTTKVTSREGARDDIENRLTPARQQLLEHAVRENDPVLFSAAIKEVRGPLSRSDYDSLDQIMAAASEQEECNSKIVEKLMALEARLSDLTLLFFGDKIANCPGVYEYLYRSSEPERRRSVASTALRAIKKGFFENVNAIHSSIKTSVKKADAGAIETGSASVEKLNRLGILFRGFLNSTAAGCSDDRILCAIHGEYTRFREDLSRLALESRELTGGMKIGSDEKLILDHLGQMIYGPFLSNEQTLN